MEVIENLLYRALVAVHDKHEKIIFVPMLLLENHWKLFRFFGSRKASTQLIEVVSSSATVPSSYELCSNS